MLFHIVEDNDLVLEITDKLLQSLGNKTKTFKQAQQYLNYVNNPEYEKPDAVLTGINKPIASKYAMIDFVSALLPELKFIIMTDRPQLPSDYLNQTHLFLKKPFDLKAVAQIIDTLK